MYNIVPIKFVQYDNFSKESLMEKVMLVLFPDWLLYLFVTTNFHSKASNLDFSSSDLFKPLSLII